MLCSSHELDHGMTWLDQSHELYCSGATEHVRIGDLETLTHSIGSNTLFFIPETGIERAQSPRGLLLADSGDESAAVG